MAQEDAEKHTRWVRTRVEGFIIPIIVIAFVSQPLIKFIDPPSLLAAGSTLAAGLTVINRWARLGARSAIQMWVSVALVVVGMFWVAVLMIGAARDSRQHDARCAAIQGDSLRGSGPLNRPDLLSALGCRPLDSE